MENINNVQNILIIEGIKQESLFETISQKFANSLEEDNKIVFDRLPQRFESVKTWPKTCNLRCNYDGFEFSTPPVFVPLTINRDGTMDVHKCFCSFPCAMNYIENNELYTNSKWELTYNLYELYKKFHGQRPKFILPASDKDVIEEYGGGKKTVYEWRTEQHKKIKMSYPI